MFVDPDEQLGVLVGTDVVRDAMSAVLGQTLLLRDHLQPGVADRHLHVQPCLRPYTHTAAAVVTFCVSRRRRKMYCGHACLSVCLSVRGRTPTLLHGPGCNLGAW